MKVLAKTVVAGGVVYPAGTPATSELETRIRNPKHWIGEPVDAPRALCEPAPADQAVTDIRQLCEPAPEDKSLALTGQPPRVGRGSGLEVWIAYATGLGLDVPNDASRGDIIALVDTHRSER